MTKRIIQSPPFRNFPPLPIGRQALQRAGIPLFGKEGLGEILEEHVFSIVDSLVNQNTQPYLRIGALSR